MQSTIDDKQATRWFYLFVFMHLICWTLVPICVRYNLPLDSIEGTIWGRQLQWGYDKNPFLNGWLTALATFLDGHSGWMIYLFSQISVSLCFWAVWQLGKKILSPTYALIAVMILEGIQYFNFHAIDFNDNTLELSLWALTSYFFYQTLSSNSSVSQRHLYWILTGIFAGLGMMAKYYTAILLTSMTLFLFLNANNRKQLTTLSPYLGLTAFIIILLPHCIWLFFHDFITVTYVIKRTTNPPSWINHIFFPAQFAWQQWEVFLPACVLFLLLLIGKKPLLNPQKIKLNLFDKEFLFYLGAGPFLLTIFLSLLLGIKLRAGWGMPLLSLWGILILAFIQPRMSQIKLHFFIAILFIFMGGLLGGYSLSHIQSNTPSSSNFPGDEIAKTITTAWKEVYHTKLSYVAGSRWVGGNIGFYSPDQPAVFIEWNKKKAPWIDLNDLQQKGAVFVWSITDGEQMPIRIQTQFPRLLKPISLEFSWRRNCYHLPPIKIGVAFLPPRISMRCQSSYRPGPKTTSQSLQTNQ